MEEQERKGWVGVVSSIQLIRFGGIQDGEEDALRTRPTT